MAQIEIFDKYVAEYEKWYEDHTEVYESELAAIREQLLKLPQNIQGIEVGLGTGRFSEPLGIKEGVEPSEAMAQKAIDRGVEVIQGVAERLPYGDLQFNFVLFVTLCHLDNVRLALQEAHRVLKHGGSILVGFLEKDGQVAKKYIEKRYRSHFYAKATFYTVDHIKNYCRKLNSKIWNSTRRFLAIWKKSTKYKYQNKVPERDLL
ncbi:MAG: class I SAM-dependent methyltransferase [Saonia sp.]